MVSFFDQPLRVTRFKLVHAVWRRQRMDMLPGVAPVSLVLARTDNTVVGLTHIRGQQEHDLGYFQRRRSPRSSWP